MQPTDIQELSNKIRQMQMDLFGIERSLPQGSNERKAVTQIRIDLGNVDGMLQQKIRTQ